MLHTCLKIFCDFCTQIQTQKVVFLKNTLIRQNHLCMWCFLESHQLQIGALIIIVRENFVNLHSETKVQVKNLANRLHIYYQLDDTVEAMRSSFWTNNLSHNIFKLACIIKMNLFILQ